MTHTKGTLLIEDSKDGLFLIVDNERKDCIAQIIKDNNPYQANAERIVKCVNEFDEISARLSEMIDVCEIKEAQNEKLREALKTAHSELSQIKKFSVISLIDMGNISEALKS